MARKIDPLQAAQWSEQEYADNVAYFEARANYDALNTIRKARQAPKKAEPKQSVVEGTIAEVLEWVGDDADRAQQALDAENYKDSPRKTLVDELETILED